MSLWPSATSNVPPSGMLMCSDLNKSMKECGMEFPIFVGNGAAAIALFPVRDKAGSTSHDHAPVRTLHFAFRTDRENFLHAQDELKKRAIPFDFQNHEISHSIYFRDPDGHQIEITTYEL